MTTDAGETAAERPRPGSTPGGGSRPGGGAGPLTEAELFRREWEVVLERREAAGLTGAEWLPADPAGLTGSAGNLVGLALSGGGLRSAMFNRGLLEALSERGLLKYVDVCARSPAAGSSPATWPPWASGRGMRRVCRRPPKKTAAALTTAAAATMTRPGPRTSTMNRTGTAGSTRSGRSRPARWRPRGSRAGRTGRGWARRVGTSTTWPASPACGCWARCRSLRCSSAAWG